jgi:hypothetical protein
MVDQPPHEGEAGAVLPAVRVERRWKAGGPQARVEVVQGILVNRDLVGSVGHFTLSFRSAPERRVP